MPITFTRKTWVDYQEGPFLEAAELNRFESAIDALINGTSRAVRLDGDTMTGGLTLSAGDLNVAAGVVKTGGTQRISNAGRIDATSIYSVDLTTGQAVVTGAGGKLVSQDYATFLGTIGAVGGRGNGAAGRVMRWSDANTATGDAGLTTAQASGATRILSIGNGSSNSAVEINGIDTAGTIGSSQVAFQALGINQWLWRVNMGSTRALDAIELRARDVAGGDIDSPISVIRQAAGEITFGGSTARPVTLTGTLAVQGRTIIAGGASKAGLITLNRGSDGASVASIGYAASATEASELRISSGGGGGYMSLWTAGAERARFTASGDFQLGGTQRISSTGAATMTSLSSTDQAGTGERLVSASAAGAQSATIAVSAFAKTILDDADAAAVRATIGAAADAGNISHAPLFTGRRTVNCPNGVETAVTPAYTLPANWWQTGKRLCVELCLFAAHNATVLAYIGSRYFATFSVVGPFRGKIVAELVCQSTGASGRFAFLGWTEVASTSGYGATYHAMNSPLFGDSQASADGIGDNWTIDTTASADVVVKIASSYGENIPMPYGSVSIYNP